MTPYMFNLTNRLITRNLNTFGKNFKVEKDKTLKNRLTLITKEIGCYQNQSMKLS